MHAMDWHWFEQHLTLEILPRWLESAVTERGVFLPRLDRQWRRLDIQIATLVSQSRLLFNFAQGWRLTGDAAYRDAVVSGAGFLLDAFRDPAHGGWVWSVSPEGQAVDERKDTYGHAFVLFGLAHAFRVTGAPEIRDALGHTWEVLDTRLRDPGHGFFLRTARDFTGPAAERSQNPVMHLFEALLAVGDLAFAGDHRLQTTDYSPQATDPGTETQGVVGRRSPDRADSASHPLAAWPEAAAFHDEAWRVAAFIRGLIRPDDGLLPESYSCDWQPLQTAGGGRIDLGHAFEWAYLLSAGVQRGLDPAYLEVAGRLLEGGLRLGLDPADGGIHGNATMEGLTRIEGKGPWQQCEAIRALIHFALLRGRDDLWAPANQVLGFVRAHFLDPEYGGWYSHLNPDGTPSNTNKGSEWKLDYHPTGMCVAVLDALRDPGCAIRDG